MARYDSNCAWIVCIWGLNEYTLWSVNYWMTWGLNKLCGFFYFSLKNLKKKIKKNTTGLGNQRHLMTLKNPSSDSLVWNFLNISHFLCMKDVVLCQSNLWLNDFFFLLNFMFLFHHTHKHLIFFKDRQDTTCDERYDPFIMNIYLFFYVPSLNFNVNIFNQKFDLLKSFNI